MMDEMLGIIHHHEDGTIRLDKKQHRRNKKNLSIAWVADSVQLTDVDPYSTSKLCPTNGMLIKLFMPLFVSTVGSAVLKKRKRKKRIETTFFLRVNWPCQSHTWASPSTGWLRKIFLPKMSLFWPLRSAEGLLRKLDFGVGTYPFLDLGNSVAPPRRRAPDSRPQPPQSLVSISLAPTLSPDYGLVLLLLARLLWPLGGNQLNSLLRSSKRCQQKKRWVAPHLSG